MPWVSADVWEEPEATLGFAIADWAEAYLRVPGGAFYGQPLQLSGWQLRAMADWYAVDRHGRWLYRRGQVRLAKKTGKSPFAGVVALAELVGPSRFDGFDARGEPVGRPPDAPWVQIAAVSEDQTQNTYSALHAMLADSPLVKEAGIDLGVTRTVLRGRPGKIEMVTASAGSREGQPITAAIMDETHLWTRQNGGRRLARTIQRNASPMGGRVLATTNAYDPGAESVAEQVEAAALQTTGVMVYGPQYEAKVEDLADHQALRAGLARAYRDAPWVDVDRVLADCLDPDMPAEDVHRFHLNVNQAADSVLATAPPTTLEELAPGEPIALGFDGSRTRDATALVAVHMVTGAAYLVDYWERPYGLPKNSSWEVPRTEVSESVERAFAVWRVARMKADPSHWQDELAGWQNRWGRDVVDRMPVWMQSVVDQAVEATQVGLESGAVTLDGSAGSEVLRAQVQWCRVPRRTVGARTLRSLAKPEDGGRIDAAAALTYAVQARMEALAKGWAPPVASELYVTFR
jgi:hypothetical protein